MHILFFKRCWWFWVRAQNMLILEFFWVRGAVSPLSHDKNRIPQYHGFLWKLSCFMSGRRDDRKCRDEEGSFSCQFSFAQLAVHSQLGTANWAKLNWLCTDLLYLACLDRDKYDWISPRQKNHNLALNNLVLQACLPNSRLYYYILVLHTSNHWPFYSI